MRSLRRHMPAPCVSRRRLVAGAALLLAGAGVAAARASDDDARVEAPAWASRHVRCYAADLVGDGGRCVVALRQGVAEVWRAGECVFTSPDEWDVTDVLVFDANRDGRDELVFLAWRVGNYGQVRPFWTSEEEDGEATQHLFVYAWRASSATFWPLWMSSRLGIEVAEAEVAGGARLWLTATDGSRSGWEWGGWGFALLAQGEPEGAPVELLAVGDNITYANTYRTARDAETGAYDFSAVYDPVRDRVAGADLAAVVQETPLVADGTPPSAYPLFATPQAMGDALADAGFGVVCAATNHVNDQGAAGLDATLAFWADVHPEVALLGVHAGEEGAYDPVLVETGGVTCALFDLTYGLNGQSLGAGNDWRVNQASELELLLPAVEAAAQDGALVVCFVHHGTEYDPVPSAGQRAVVERLVDAGAALVVCSHGHVVGPFETLRRASGATGVVFWGLGNFMASQRRPDTVVGAAARVRVEKPSEAGGPATVAGFELVPTVCHVGGDGVTSVHWLEDYTDELAAAHWLSDDDEPLTVNALWRLFLAGATTVVESDSEDAATGA